MNLLAITLLSWLFLGCMPLPYFFRFLNIAAAFLTSITALSSIQQTPLIFHAFTFNMDPLSAFFVFLLGASALGVTCFGQSYFRHFTNKKQFLIQSAQAFFILSMLMVFTASNTFTFLFSWELMTLSSYFTVVAIHSNKTTRQAGFLYLGIAHCGFLAIATFFLLDNSAGSIPLANFAFILAFLGFGAKAGLFPFHIWLPEAHPAAPSPISALMSGVMLKTAVYALIRSIFYVLISYQQIWWAYVLISIGLISMLTGVLFSAIQTDMKRLLAYSSMENLGFIVLVLGLAILFYQYQEFALAGAALLIVLLHSLSHALFKSLLFLSTGSILHATGERNIGKLGGLIQKMPWLSVCTLIGCFSMAGLPLFSGFISEWLYLQLFFHPLLQHHFNFELISSIIMAMSVLVFGLAAFVIVKFFGIAFLGQARDPTLVHAKNSSWLENIALSWLALGCILIGVWPMRIVSWLQPILNSVSPKLMTNPWVDAPSTLHFNPPILALVLLLSLLVLILLIKVLRPIPSRPAISWSGGFTPITARMQESAAGFSQPIQKIFSNLITVKTKLPNPEDVYPHYASELREKIWSLFYYPLVQFVLKIVSLTKWVQQGKISVYLTYIGLTLLALLIWVVWL